MVQWNGTSEGRRVVERNQKADGEYSMENEKKKKKDGSDRGFGEPNALAAKFDLGHTYEDSGRY